MGTLRAQGTELYIIDPDNGNLLTVGCVTTLDGIDATWDQIETTCLEDLDKSFEPSLRSPGQMTFGINYDPANTVHNRLHAIYEAGSVDIKYAVGASDGTAAPTVDSNDDWVLPTSRTWINFLGFFTSFPFNFSQGQLVQPQIGVQISGGKTLTVKV